MEKRINEYELGGLLGGGSHQFDPVFFFPLHGFPVMAVFFFLGLEILMMHLPLAVAPYWRHRLVAHFMMHRQLQNAHGNKILFQPRVNANQLVFGIIGTEAKGTTVGAMPTGFVDSRAGF